MSKRSFLDKQRAEKRWDDKIIDRIQIARLIDRMQANALNELPTRPTQVRDFLARLAERWGVEKWNPTTDTNWALSQLLDLEMSMAQVKSAEVLLRKALPDLAQVESNTKTSATNVVLIPQIAQATGDWTRTVQSSERGLLLDHDRNSAIAANGHATHDLAAPTGTADVPADVPGS